MEVMKVIILSMHKLLTSLLLFTQVFAVSVDMGDVNDPISYGRTKSGSNFEIIVRSSGDGKSKDAAFTVYMPVNNVHNQQTGRYYTSITGLLPNAQNSEVVGGIQFILDVDTNSETDQRLLFAVRKDSDSIYKIVSKDITPTNNFFVSMSDICTSGTDMDCATLDDTSSTTPGSRDDIVDAYFYAFLSDVKDVGEEINPDNYDGVHFRIYFSTDILDYINSNTAMRSLEVDRGDQTAYVDYAGIIETTTYMRGLAVYDSGTLLDTFETGSSESGTVEVRNLTNGTTYNIEAFFIDRFGYKSNSSVGGTIAVKPTAIESLLEGKQCYLVTAGFQRDHYVLDYFRYLRDTYLLTNTVGKLFVNFYYATAPQYAHYIYESESLSATVRLVSYVTYFFIRNFYAVVAMMALLYAFVVRRRVVQKVTN
jgi:hypothetical protein